MRKTANIIAAAGALLTATPALAASLSSSTGLTGTATAGGVATNNDLATLVGRFVFALSGLLGIIFILLVIYAGFLWMTAAGNDEKVKQAKKIIASAVGGLVLIFTSYALVTFVVNALATATAQ